MAAWRGRVQLTPTLITATATAASLFVGLLFSRWLPPSLPPAAIPCRSWLWPEAFATVRSFHHPPPLPCHSCVLLQRAGPACNCCKEARPRAEQQCRAGKRGRSAQRLLLQGVPAQHQASMALHSICITLHPRPSSVCYAPSNSVSLSLA